MFIDRQLPIRQAAALVGASLLLACGVALAADSPVDPHAHHHLAATGAAPAAAKVSQVAYKIPPVPLLRADGKAVTLASELADKRPVMLNFIFTTCTAICPVMSQVFAEVQQQLGADSKKLHMVSISIDPENDTAQRLSAYAASYKAGPQWTFYTGSAAASIEAQRAFAAYHGDKMNHEPLTLLRKAPGEPWMRLEGLASPGQLIKQLQSMQVAKAS